MPEGAVYVGRPSAWGNPYTGPDAVERYRGWAEAQARWARAEVLASWWLTAIEDRDLVCWCPLDQPCHADVLLDLANA
jgi:hypothetical protein